VHVIHLFGDMSISGRFGHGLVCTFMLLCSVQAQAPTTAAVIIKNGNYIIFEGDSKHAAAAGSFRNAQGTKSGWAQLYIETSAEHSDDEQMRAAGYLVISGSYPTAVDSFAGNVEMIRPKKGP